MTAAADECCRRAMYLYEGLEAWSQAGECALLLTNMARLAGEVDAAADLAQAGHDLFALAGDRRGVGRCLLARGICEKQQGRNDWAEWRFTEAAAHFREAGDERYLGDALLAMATVSPADSEAAVLLLGDAELHFGRAKDVKGQARALCARGWLEVQRGRPAEGEWCLWKALTLPRNLDAFHAHSLSALGSLAAETGETSRALDFFRRAMATYNRLNDIRGRSGVYLARGSMRADCGASAEGKIQLTRASEGFRETNDPREAACLTKIAAICLDGGDIAGAREASQDAVAIVDRLGSSLGPVFSLVEHGSKWEAVYVTAVRCAVAAGNTSAAISYAARLQARALAEMSSRSNHAGSIRYLLTPADATELEDIDAELGDRRHVEALALERARALDERDRAGASAHEMIAAEVEFRVHASDPDGQTSRLLARKAQIERAAELRLLESVPAGDPEPVDVDAIRQALMACSDHTALVDLVWRDGVHLALVMGPDGAVNRHVYDQVDEIETAIAELAQLGGLAPGGDEVRDALCGSEDDRWHVLVDGLRERLWKPLEVWLVGVTAIAVSADPALAALPLRSLAAKGKRLRMLPGPALLLHKPITEAVSGLLAVGSKPTTGSDGRWSAVGQLLDLLHRHGQVRDADNDPAQALVQATGHYRLLFLVGHVAGHPSRPEKAAIELTDGSGRPRQVSAYQLLRLQVKARLVVVAGCNAAGPSGGSSYVGVGAAALVGAGAEAVLATPYEVSAEAALVLGLAVLPWLEEGADLDAVVADALDIMEALTADNIEQMVARLAHGAHLEPASERELVGTLKSLALRRNVRGNRRPLLFPADRLGWVLMGPPGPMAG